jgi:hypothetical protein
MNEKLEALRRRIEHEDNLINQRLSSLLASQSFLVTAFAISLNAPTVFRSNGFGAANMILAMVIPWVAVACVLFLALTLIGAIMSLAVLRKEATKYTMPGDLEIHSPALIRRLGLAAPVAVPLVFLIFWLVVLACDFRVHP